GHRARRRAGPAGAMAVRQVGRACGAGRGRLAAVPQRCEARARRRRTRPHVIARKPIEMKMRCAVLSAALLLSLPSLALADRGFQASDMVSMDRYSSPVLSPDGRKVVFAKRVVDMEAGKASTSLWIEDLFARDAAPPVRLTPEGWNVNSPAFSGNGITVYFLSGKSGR